MKENEILVKGALLHDIGKVCRRAYNKMGNHSQAGKDFLAEFLAEKDTDVQKLFNCISYHHSDYLKQAQLENNDLAYIVYEADNIAAGMDRRANEGATKDGFNSTLNLNSIFSVFNSDNTSSAQNKYPLCYKDTAQVFNYPQSDAPKATVDTYKNLFGLMKERFTAVNIMDLSNNQLLQLLEDCFAYVPSSTSQKEVCDISLYIHVKLTAAIANCMKIYFDDNGIDDYKKYCFNSTAKKSFKDKKIYTLISGDISGIQNFIYTIPSKGALKTLRGRSIYLDLLLENFIDELLTELNLSRANLIYSGGGHFYLLAPSKIDLKLKKMQLAFNKWLLKNIGINLYLAIGKADCSANDLTNSQAQGNLFATVNKEIKIDKLSRYNIEDTTVKAIFSQQSLNILDDLLTPANHVNDTHKLECSICHNLTEKLYTYTGNEQIACDFCLSLYKLGEAVLTENAAFIISDTFLPEYNIKVKLFGKSTYYYMYPISLTDIETFVQNNSVVRIYSKNAVLEHQPAIRLYLADYSAKTVDSKLMTFDDLARSSCGADKGINRLGVLRIDVDDLGIAFTSGFLKDDISGEDNNRYATLSRYADLAKDISMFFKVAINKICAGNLKNIIDCHERAFTIFGADKNKKRNINIVYSGGDDLFLVGAWDDVLETAVDIRHAFRQFTNDKLSFSAGMAMFSPTYPISKMAEVTEALLNLSKSMINKDSIALFGFNTNITKEQGLSCKHIYKWQDFEHKVCAEKICFLRKNCTVLNLSKSLIYRLLDLLDLIEEDNFNIARFAYILGRMQPQNTKLLPAYEKFAATMYRWINNDEDRKQLATAMNLLVYYLRDKKG